MLANPKVQEFLTLKSDLRGIETKTHGAVVSGG